MDGEPSQPKATMTSFVYDTRTGKVVHIHQFVPYGDGTISEAEMAKTAMELAPDAWDRKRLAVLHHGKGHNHELRPEHRFRVDLGTRRLVVEQAPQGPAQR
jgi:hypothetical protein